jgi:hypothetical protein
MSGAKAVNMLETVLTDRATDVGNGNCGDVLWYHEQMAVMFQGRSIATATSIEKLLSYVGTLNFPTKQFFIKHALFF